MRALAPSTSGVSGTDRPIREPARCWQCGGDHAPALFCPACDAIQPLPPGADHFQVLGLPRRLAIDADLLQRRYYDLNRRVHPDLHQQGGAVAREASLQLSAAINTAYRILRDPVERGLYWLLLQGERLGADNTRVPADLAALVFTVQEKLEALRAGPGQTDEAVAARAEIGADRADLSEREATLLEHLRDNFKAWDADGADAVALCRDLKAVLSALAYVRTLIRDVDKELSQ